MKPQPEQYEPERFNLSRPLHLLARGLLDRIGRRNNCAFGSDSQADVEMLLRQIRDYFTRGV